MTSRSGDGKESPRTRGTKSSRRPPSPQGLLEVEQAILGTMLKHGDCVASVKATLCPQDFSTNAGVCLCRVLFDMDAKGERIDVESASEALCGRGWLDDLGGAGRGRAY